MAASLAIPAALVLLLAATEDPRVQTELPGRSAASRTRAGDPGGGGLPGFGGGAAADERGGREAPAPTAAPDDAAPDDMHDGAGLPPRRSYDPDASRRRSSSPSFSLPAPGTLGHAVLIALVLAVIAALVVVVARSISGLPPPSIAAPADDAGPGAAKDDGRRGPSRPPPGLAERLAAEGRFTEAVHVLLLESIVALGRVAPQPPESRTSRELLAHFGLRGPLREDFAGVVLAVERSLFGGQSLGREDYESCAQRVERLRRWRAEP